MAPSTNKMNNLVIKDVTGLLRQPLLALFNSMDITYIKFALIFTFIDCDSNLTHSSVVPYV